MGGGCTELHNEEFNNVYSLTNVIRTTKSRGMRPARHVALMRESRYVHKSLVRKSRERYNLEGLGADEKIIF